MEDEARRGLQPRRLRFVRSRVGWADGFIVCPRGMNLTNQWASKKCLLTLHLDTLSRVCQHPFGGKVIRYLIVLEQTESGFSVQVPDLAIVTHGINIEAAKQAARGAIQVNLEAYREIGQAVPEKLVIQAHFENPELNDLLFAYVEVPDVSDKIAA